MPQIRTKCKTSKDNLRYKGGYEGRSTFLQVRINPFHVPCPDKPSPQLPSPHLKAGNNEVYSFFWRKDFKEAIACYQNEPRNQAETSSKAESLAPQLQQNPSKLFYEYPRSNPNGKHYKSHLKIPQKHQMSSVLQNLLFTEVKKFKEHTKDPSNQCNT